MVGDHRRDDVDRASAWLLDTHMLIPITNPL